MHRLSLFIPDKHDYLALPSGNQISLRDPVDLLIDFEKKRVEYHFLISTTDVQLLPKPMEGDHIYTTPFEMDFATYLVICNANIPCKVLSSIYLPRKHAYIIKIVVNEGIYAFPDDNEEEKEEIVRGQFIEIDGTTTVHKSN